MAVVITFLFRDFLPSLSSYWVSDHQPHQASAQR